jgi:hypothetical protein
MPEWMVAVERPEPGQVGHRVLGSATWRASSGPRVKPMALLVGIGALGFASGVAALVSWREV